MTFYVGGYDDAEKRGIPGARAVVAVHRKLNFPATFNIHTKPLEDDPELAREYKELLCDPANNGLFEVLPHSHTHPIMQDHATLGKAVSYEQLQYEVSHSKRLIEDIFENPVEGFRGTNGYYNGWKGQPHLLQLMQGNGITFFSSFAMGPGDTVPAPLTQPYFYSEDGFPDLMELPVHDWHDNVLQGWPHLSSAWPPCVPAGLPNRVPETPEEKFQVYRPNMQWASDNDIELYSPAFHPFAINRFEPEATYLEKILRYALELGMTPLTQTQFARQWREKNL